MKKIIFIALINLIFISTSAFSAKTNFQFQISDYHTKRQYGQTIDIYVRYAIKDHVDYKDYPDYRALREVTIKYLQPTEALPIETYWEILAAKLGDELIRRYPLAGISVQMLVHPNEYGTVSEPGFHGPIYTVGDVIPFSQAVLPINVNRQA